MKWVPKKKYGPSGQGILWRGGGGGRDALEGKGLQRRPEKRLDRRLEEVAKAVGGGYCRLPKPFKLAPAVRETVAGDRLGALEAGGGGSPPSNASLGGGGGYTGVTTAPLFGAPRAWPFIFPPTQERLDCPWRAHGQKPGGRGGKERGLPVTAAPPHGPQRHATH